MFDNLYQDVGMKIKKLALWIFIVEMIFSVVSGMLLCFTGGEFEFFIGLGVIVGGALTAYVSSWFLYGFGEIIDKLTDIERNTRHSVTKTTSYEFEAFGSPKDNKKNQSFATVTKTQANHKWRCPSCGQMISEYPCQYCGYSNITDNT